MKNFTKRREDTGSRGRRHTPQMLPAHAVMPKAAKRERERVFDRRGCLCASSHRRSPHEVTLTQQLRERSAAL
jgi:hypothetical protein